MADQVQQQEAPAGSADIEDQFGQLILGEMMRQVHGEGDIGRRQTVANGIRSDNGNRPGRVRRPLQVYPHYFHAQLGANVPQDSASAASNIQHAADWKGIAAQSGNDRARIAKQAVNACQVAMSTRDLLFGDFITLQRLRLE